MEWMPIQITEILHICLKLTIGNLLEMIKHKITGLKIFQLLTGLVQKPSLQEKTPDWLTTGITYLIPKSGDSKEVRNYRPIISLTTTYCTKPCTDSCGSLVWVQVTHPHNNNNSFNKPTWNTYNIITLFTALVHA